MIPLQDLLIFAAAALLMVLTPGPNMIYLISRSICQGRKAGVTSLLGVVAGFFVHLFAAAAGLTAVFLAVPMAYEVLKWAGALYLLWLAWQAVKPGARSPFEAQQLPPDSSRKLITMGFLTSALNPKIAVFYFAFLPQFVLPGAARPTLSVFVLGLVFAGLTFLVKGPVGLGAGLLSGWLRSRPKVIAWLHRTSGAILIGLGLKLAFERRA